MSKYPEHEKLQGVKDQSQAVGEFLEWLKDEKKVTLAVHHEHSDDCYADVEDFLNGGTRKSRMCGYRDDDLQTFYHKTNDLLAEFFGIDQKALDDEKDAMLEEIRAANNPTPEARR